MFKSTEYLYPHIIHLLPTSNYLFSPVQDKLLKD